MNFHVNISVNITDSINIKEQGDQIYNKDEKERKKGFCTGTKCNLQKVLHFSHELRISIVFGRFPVGFLCLSSSNFFDICEAKKTITNCIKTKANVEEYYTLSKNKS